MKHRLAYPGVVPLEVIEVQCGEYLGLLMLDRRNVKSGRTRVILF